MPKEPSDRTLQEQLAGRRLVTKNMIEGLVEQICKDYRIDRDDVELVMTHHDPREWTVDVTLADGIKHSESAWAFPTDELKAMVMLLNK